MSNEEAKQAFFAGAPVIWKEIVYARISAIIYRLDRYGHLIVSAELQDKCGHSLTIARVQELQGVSECNS